MTQDFEVCQAGELARIRAQRDALAETLQNIEEWATVCFPEYATDDLPVIATARDLLKRAEVQL